MPKPQIDLATIKAVERAVESILLKGEDAKISNGPDGSIKVYGTKTTLVLNTGKTKKRASS